MQDDPRKGWVYTGTSLQGSVVVSFVRAQLPDFNNLRKDVISDINRTHKTPTIRPSITKPKSQWSIHWHNQQKQIIFGRTLSQDTSHSSSITYLQHYIPNQTHHDVELTKKTTPVFNCLSGMHNELILPFGRSSNMRYRYPYPTFKIYQKTSFVHKSLANFYNASIPYYIATKPLHSLRHIAYEHFLKLEKNPLQIITPNSIDPTPSNNSIQTALLSQIHAHIDSALLCHNNIKKELKLLASQLEKETLLTFYTDGSVKHIGTSRCSSGYEWIQCQANTPNESFHGSTIFFPSSTKSESMGHSDDYWNNKADELANGGSQIKDPIILTDRTIVNGGHCRLVFHS
uniref:Uncharacterized protein n=1 Tax=Rhizophagus irregularis (strain DAOM 181602 / DAOM 197198 / MUCL 43194) TaxID=747089 RepID=U9SQ53_RHIID